MPLRDVANKFGVCVTFFKKVCRAHGINRWPHRKVVQIQKICEKLGEAPTQMTVRELSAIKEKEETEARGPRPRVPVWDTVKKRKLSGMAAPLERNLPLYLREHPNCEVYTGQDGDAFSRSSKRARPASDHDESAEQPSDRHFVAAHLVASLADSLATINETATHIPRSCARSQSSNAESSSTVGSTESVGETIDFLEVGQQQEATPISQTQPQLESALNVAWIPGRPTLNSHSAIVKMPQLKTQAISIDVPPSHISPQPIGPNQPVVTFGIVPRGMNMLPSAQNQSAADFVDVLDDTEFNMFVNSVNLPEHWNEPGQQQCRIASYNSTKPSRPVDPALSTCVYDLVHGHPLQPAAISTGTPLRLGGPMPVPMSASLPPVQTTVPARLPAGSKIEYAHTQPTSSIFGMQGSLGCRQGLRRNSI